MNYYIIMFPIAQDASESPAKISWEPNLFREGNYQDESFILKWIYCRSAQIFR